MAENIFVRDKMSQMCLFLVMPPHVPCCGDVPPPQVIYFAQCNLYHNARLQCLPSGPTHLSVASGRTGASLGNFWNLPPGFGKVPEGFLNSFFLFSSFCFFLLCFLYFYSPFYSFPFIYLFKYI